MTGKEPRKSRKTAIVKSFGDLVAEKGYDEVSLREIAARLDISKGTILHHFGSKEQLLEQLHADYMRRRLAEAEIIIGELPDPVQRLGGIVFQLMTSEENDRAATVAFAREISRFRSNDSMAGVRRMRFQYAQLVRAIVQDGINDGTFAPAEASLVALQMLGMCNWSWTWYRPDGKHSAEEIAATFTRSLLGGLLAGREVLTADQLRHIAEVVRAAMATVAAQMPDE